MGTGLSVTPRGRGAPRHPTGGSLQRRIAVLGALVAAGAGVVAIVAGQAGTSGAVLVGLGSSNGGLAATRFALEATSAARTSATQSFSISGSVGDLFPGETLPLVLTVNNPQTYSLTVTSITTKVKRTAAPGCTHSNLTVTPFHGRLRLTSHGTGQATVLVTMALAAPDACEGVRFPLHYLGLAKATR